MGPVARNVICVRGSGLVSQVNASVIIMTNCLLIVISSGSTGWIQALAASTLRNTTHQLLPLDNTRLQTVCVTSRQGCPTALRHWVNVPITNRTRVDLASPQHLPCHSLRPFSQHNSQIVAVPHLSILDFDNDGVLELTVPAEFHCSDILGKSGSRSSVRINKIACRLPLSFMVGCSFQHCKKLVTPASSSML